MKIRLLHLFFIAALLFWSCEDENKLANEISKVSVDFNVERFDRILANAEAENLASIKKDYPFLFPKQIDSVWVNQLQSPIQQQIFSETESKFGDLELLKEDLHQLFQHIKYYDKGFKAPRVIIAADYVNYRSKLILEQDLLIINLSNYLGANHEFYQNTPVYFAENMTPEQIIPDVALKYAERYAYQSQRKTFLDELIFHGKLLYFKDVMMPSYLETEKIGYTKEDIAWAKINEEQIWSYFVEKEMLFSTDPKLYSRFTVPAPFSKFYLELDNQSPGRIGQYIGWQIVRAYAERSNKDIVQIMRTDADVIFKESKYKPNR
ncbi:gliding motility lipoprotein GldB [Winogradskyella litorisediminis]|uniref:Gliding motility lipoprotein GldB n=1 Tax=Winogradskyella litorisediminis TaxID=1156618 RepID=A0ABW3N9W3_9FLAO